MRTATRKSPAETLAEYEASKARYQAKWGPGGPSAPSGHDRLMAAATCPWCGGRTTVAHVHYLGCCGDHCCGK